MLLADTFAIFLVVAGILISFPCMWLVCRALWPEVVRHSVNAASKSLFKSFWLGLILTALAVAIVVALGKLPGSAGQILGVVSFSILFLIAQIGVASLATLVGQRLPSPADESRPWKSTQRGGTVLVISFLFPLVGWFLLLPGSIVVGLGTVVRGAIRCSRAARRNGRKVRKSTENVLLAEPDSKLQSGEAIASTEAVDLVTMEQREPV